VLVLLYKCQIYEATLFDLFPLVGLSIWGGNTKVSSLILGRGQ